MTTITIPEKLTLKKELVIIPRDEYEEFLIFKKLIPTYKPSRSELRVIEQGRKNVKDGKFVEWHQLKNELAVL